VGQENTADSVPLPEAQTGCRQKKKGKSKRGGARGEGRRRTSRQNIRANSLAFINRGGEMNDRKEKRGLAGCSRGTMQKGDKIRGQNALQLGTR